MYSLGYDIGSSSVKVSLINIETGKCINSTFYPKEEMIIHSPQAGFAEQHPDEWWKNLVLATKELLSKLSSVDKNDIKSIGISYQMHGLVMIDKNKNVIRPSIIWCDSRAVEIGQKAFKELGEQKCLEHYLNSPGNFTASKLKWVKDNEFDNYNRIYKIMLPGDFIAMRLTGNINTTKCGLSEAILWDFKNNTITKDLLNYYGISEDFIPEIISTFSNQGNITNEAAAELGLSIQTTVNYRAGDQPNNALSLNVLEPGEVAATAGTSGVVYGVSDKIKYDTQSRINTFAHVNHSIQNTRLGVLLCINGTGILNSWVKNKLINNQISYADMNAAAEKTSVGSDGLVVLPFGNGAERILQNKNIGAQFCNINFNTHSQAHIYRAIQEGIVFSIYYGIQIMQQVGVETKTIRAGNANMFLSPLFASALATVSSSSIELYDTDGSQGAARAAAYGAGYYKNLKDAFVSLNKIKTIEPEIKNKEAYQQAYDNWVSELNKLIK